MKKFLQLLFAFLPALASAMPALDTLAPRPREMLLSSLHFTDGYWDDRAALLWSTAPTSAGASRRHGVRDTSWYALGLLMRDQPGDRERAVRAIEAVMAQQMIAPGEKWNGTFFRAPEEPQPMLFAREWEDFDPNWRQFIGTTFALILIEFEPRLPVELSARLEAAIRRAVEGELIEGRIEPFHTNISLQQSFLLTYAGRRLHRADWTEKGEALAQTIYADFKPNQTFDEYNSPTYYGVDLYALALWRKHGATPLLKKLGAEMEAGLWRDIARFYHAGLRNLAGPYDRSYGMDMHQYVALTGLWLSLALPKELTPLPDPGAPMDHANDYIFTPLYVLLGPQIPADALPHFQSFQGERTLNRVITIQRTATAWLGDDIMLGGEITHLSRAAGIAWSQFHPATIHWRTPSGSIGWVLLKTSPRVDARATKNTLTITAIGDSTFRICATGLSATQLTRNRWTIPGLIVTVETDATGFSITRGDGFIDVQYREATHFVLHTARQL